MPASASETGLAAQTIRNLRGELKRDGLIRSVPQKDDAGTIERWLIERTGAVRPSRSTVTGDPVTVSDESADGFGSTKPLTAQIPILGIRVTGRSSERETSPVTVSVGIGTGSLTGSLTAGCASTARECQRHGDSRHWRSVASGDIHCVECIAPVVEGAVAEWIEAA